MADQRNIKSIWKKLTVNGGNTRWWKIEGAIYPIAMKTQWSRSTPGSNLVLDTGFSILEKVDCGGYNKDMRDQEIDLSRPSIVFAKSGGFVTLTSPNKATVLIELVCVFPDDDRLVLESISEAKGSDRAVVLAEEWQPIPVELVDVSHLAEA